MSALAHTFTLCGVSQFTGVKIRLPGFVDIPLVLVTVTVTSALGWLFRTTVYDTSLGSPPSSTVRAVGVTVTPTASSSAMLTTVVVPMVTLAGRFTKPSLTPSPSSSMASSTAEKTNDFSVSSPLKVTLLGTS